MNNKLMLYVDQYGEQWTAKTVKELRSQIGGGGSRVSKMYTDKTDGSSRHIGYVIGQHWCRAFVPFEAKR